MDSRSFRKKLLKNGFSKWPFVVLAALTILFLILGFIKNMTGKSDAQRLKNHKGDIGTYAYLDVVAFDEWVCTYKGQLLTNEFASLCLPGGNRRSSPTFGVRQPDPSAEALGLAAHRGVIDCTPPGEACSAGAVPFSGTRVFRRYSFPIR